MPERVLVTGARAPAALDMARSFAAAGFEVHMADCAAGRMARASRSVTALHRYPSPRSDPAGFRQSIAGIVSVLRPRMIVPTCEEVFHLAMIEGLPAPLFAPAWPMLARLHSKAAFAEDCLWLGLPVPATSVLESRADCNAFGEHSEDYVFKREFSRFGASTVIGPTRKALDAISPSSRERWVAQRRVFGVEVSFYAISVESQLTAFTAYRSTWKFAGGAGFAFEPLDEALAARIRAVASVLAERLIPHGQFACDLIVDADGQPWLLECNPRATSGVHFLARSPQLALAMLGGLPGTPLEDARQLHVAPALWTYGLVQALKGRRYREWSDARKSGRDVVAAERDGGPVLGALLDTVAFSAKALVTRKNLVEVTTADIEWNGEAL